MRFCLHCSADISSKEKKVKFCNRSCSSTFNNKQRFNRNGLRCKGCNNSIQRQGNRTYCSMSCRQDHQVKLWLTDEFDPTVKAGLSQPFRNWLLRESNFKCQECQWSKVNHVTGKVPLTIDHIDGNYKNNKRSNLRVLCPNCHSLTPTYGALNAGKGRDFRYLRL